MAKNKKRLIKPEILRLKRNLQAKIRYENKKLSAQGIPSDRLFSTSLKGMRTKKEVIQHAKRFQKSKADKFVQNKKGLWLRESEIRKFNANKDKANKRIKKDLNDNRERRQQIQRSLYGKKQPMTRDDEKGGRTYTRDIDDFNNVRDLQEFENRMYDVKTKGVKGAWGQDLKERLLKAIRGEVYKPPNGYSMHGDESGLADFIEEHLSADEVEVLFEGNLNFTYIYGFENHFIKELVVIRDIIKTTSKGELWDKLGYEEKFVDYVQSAMESLPEELSDDISERMAEISELL